MPWYTASPAGLSGVAGASSGSPPWANMGRVPKSRPIHARVSRPMAASRMRSPGLAAGAIVFPPLSERVSRLGAHGGRRGLAHRDSCREPTPARESWCAPAWTYAASRATAAGLKRQRSARLRKSGGIRANTQRTKTASSAVVSSSGSRQSSDMQVPPTFGQSRTLSALYNPRVI